jgi:hypothetical protein
MVLVCSQGIANGNVQEKNIWKLFQIDKKAFLISDDNEIWLLHGLQPNSLTWGEWVWREDVPQPDACYFFNMEKWEEGKKISIVYSPWQDCVWKDTYRNDASLLQRCDYVIENDIYKTHVFAKPLQIDEVNALYANLHEHAFDLIKMGFFGLAAGLLEQELVFVIFKEKVLTECKNKMKGKPFDGQYTAFYEKHGPFYQIN